MISNSEQLTPELEAEFKKIFERDLKKNLEKAEEIIALGHAENIVYGTGDREPKGFINATGSCKKLR